MTIMLDAKNERKKGKKPRENSPSLNAKFVAYHPTEADKAYLRDGDGSLEQELPMLTSYLQTGNRVTFGISSRTGTFYATIREKTNNWKEDRSLTTFHNEPDIALRLLVRGLVIRFPHFPEMSAPEQEIEVDW